MAQRRKRNEVTIETLAAASSLPAPREPDAVLPPAPGFMQQARQVRLVKQSRQMNIRGPINTAVRRRGIPEPKLPEAGSRSVAKQITWRTVSSRITDGMLATSASVPASFTTKLDNETDVLNSYWGYVGILEPEYDLLEPWSILDTEAYFKQATDRRLSLSFRNGVEIIGDNQNFVDYITRRTNQIGFVTGQQWQSFLRDILWNLWVCSNCVLVKIRDEKASGGKANEKNAERTPIAGYKIVPPQTIFPYLDGKGRIEKWRRFFGMGKPFRDYPVEDIVHLYWDRKPGHMFGTPRIYSVRDDIFALRRLEENIELLLVNHLFPLFHVAVGTEKAPAELTAEGISEVDVIKRLIMDMPKEGVLVTDERVKVEVKGAGGEGVDPYPMVEHYKARIFTGLGTSGLDLGEARTGNRATGDHVSQNLKDAVKADLDLFSGMISMGFFKDFFEEAPGGLSVQNAVSDVHLEFHEIDVDTMIKKETHAMNAFNNHALSQTEMRKRMKAKPVEKDQEKDMHFDKHILSLKKFDAKTQKDMSELSFDQQKELQKLDQKHELKQQAASTASNEKVAVHKTASTKQTKVTRKFANGGSHTKHTIEPTSGAAKTAAAIMQPSNQHGKNLDPHKAKSAQDPDLLARIYDELLGLDDSGWEAEVERLVEQILPGSDTLSARARLNSYARLSSDPDILWANLQTWALDPFEDGLPVPPEIVVDWNFEFTSAQAAE